MVENSALDGDNAADPPTHRETGVVLSRSSAASTSKISGTRSRFVLLSLLLKLGFPPLVECIVVA